MDPSKGSSATSPQQQGPDGRSSGAPALLAGRLDAQAAALQSMLGSLAAKAEATERAAQQGTGPATISAGPQQQSGVGDALKDIVFAEKAMDNFESRLDALLSRLDSLIDDSDGSTPQQPEPGAAQMPLDAMPDLPESWLSQLETELDEAGADVELLHKFSGGRGEHRQLADSIREQQRGAERLLERLRVSAEDSSSADERAALQEAIDKHTARAKQLQRSFRSALLQYRGNAAETARKERELLLSGATTPAELRKRKAQAGQTALSAAADVTTALQETVGMMNQEIEKSASNIIAMQTSSDALRKTKAQYMSMDDLLHMSKRMVRALEQADAMDRWLVLGGLLLFSLVALNILRKRVWIPGLYTLFCLLRYAVTLGSGSGSGGSSPAETGAQAVASITSGLLAQAAATPMASVDAASSTATANTLVLSLAKLAADTPPPSIEVLDTLGTTGRAATGDSQAPTADAETFNGPVDAPDAERPVLAEAEARDEAIDREHRLDGGSGAQEAQEVVPQAAQPGQPEIAPGGLNLRPDAKPGLLDERRKYKPPVERPKTLDR